MYVCICGYSMNQKNAWDNLVTMDNFPFPDIQVLLLTAQNIPAPIFNWPDNWSDIHGYNNIDEGIDFDDPDVPIILVGIQLLHPKSRGYIGLKSNNILDPPLIQPNFLQDEYDINALYEAYVTVENIFEKSISFKSKFYEGVAESESVRNAKTPKNKEEKIKQNIRDMIVSVYHPIDTCKLGDI